MPHKTYRHPCGHGRRQWPVCPECGVPGVYDEWGYSVTEMMGRYVNRRGVRPNGPNRDYADALLADALCRCLRCQGRGTLRTPDESYQPCPRRHGDGVRPTMPLAELDALRERIFERYPDARCGEKRKEGE